MRSIALALILAFSLTVPSAAYAGTIVGLEREEYSEMPLEWFSKLGRGLKNIVYSPLEIPFNAINQGNLASSAEIVKDRDFTGRTRWGYFMRGAFAGTLTGIAWMAARIVTGTIEVVTFPFEFRMEPLMTPETPLELTYGRD